MGGVEISGRQLLALVVLLLCFGGGASAATKSSSSSASINVIESRAGQQLPLNAFSGPINFAGRTINLNSFSGFLGQSVDVAYLVTVKGGATIGELNASSGDVMILPAFSGDPGVEKFDAERFYASLSDEYVRDNPDIMSSLEALVKKQSRAIFLGRYSPTSLNLSAPGSAGNELTRRSIVSDDAINAIRFSDAADATSIQRSIIDAMEEALASGDVETVAAFVNPAPFGAADIRGAPNQARLLYAKRMLEGHDWTALLAQSRFNATAEDFVWTLSVEGRPVTLTLMPFGDFIYIKSIEQGV